MRNCIFGQKFVFCHSVSSFVCGDNAHPASSVFAPFFSKIQTFRIWAVFRVMHSKTRPERNASNHTEHFSYILVSGFLPFDPTILKLCMQNLQLNWKNFRWKLTRKSLISYKKYYNRCFFDFRKAPTVVKI